MIKIVERQQQGEEGVIETKMTYVKAHQPVLIAQSGVFAKLLEECEEIDQDGKSIDVISPQTEKLNICFLETILHFLYTGQLTLYQDIRDNLDLLDCAYELEIDELPKVFSAQFFEELNLPLLIIRLFEETSQKKLVGLESQLLELICLNAESFLLNAPQGVLGELSASAIAKIVKQDTLSLAEKPSGTNRVSLGRGRSKNYLVLTLSSKWHCGGSIDQVLSPLTVSSY